MKYWKVRFLLSLTGIIGLIIFVSSCGTRSSNIASQPTTNPELPDLQKDIQKATDNLPISQRLPNNTLVYKGPTEQTTPAGAFVSGTSIKYVGLTNENTVEVRIDGQRALKRRGDSLDWRGNPVPGVEMKLSDRILWFSQERLQLAGTVHLTIKQISPKPGSVPKISESSPRKLIVYKLPVIYRVQSGETIPGTTLIYQGKTDNGAKLKGFSQDEYPYRQAGDSISWQGQLRSQVYLDFVGRTVLYNNDSLNVTGLATLILVPS